METNPRRWFLFFAVLCLLPLKQTHGEGLSRHEAAANQSRVTLEGTSNLHDWRAEGHEINGYVELDEMQRIELLKGDPPATTVWTTADLKAEVSIPAQSLKSGLIGLEEKVWEHLNYREHPNILYSFAKADLKHGSGSSGYSFETEGRLTVNGVTRRLLMAVTIKELHADDIVIECRTKVKMSDFKITPPRVFAGLIKAGNEVEIVVHWFVAPKIIKRDS
jgi:hypothetical protein